MFFVVYRAVFWRIAAPIFCSAEETFCNFFRSATRHSKYDNNNADDPFQSVMK